MAHVFIEQEKQQQRTPLFLQAYIYPIRTTDFFLGLFFHTYMFQIIKYFKHRLLLNDFIHW